MYSDLYTKPRLNPFKISLGIIVASVFSFAIFLLFQNTAPTRASKLSMIEHEVVNVSPKQIGVFWAVEEADEGYVLYGKNPGKLDAISQDKGSTSDSKLKRKFHLVILSNLESDTEYFYKIVSNKEILSENKKDLFSASTLPSDEGTTGLSPIYGSVINPNGEKAEGVFVMTQFANSYPQAAITGSTGEWLMPLQYIVDKNTQKLVILDEKTPISIQFFNDDRKSLVSSTANRTRPMPQIITLGNNYSFIGDENVLSAQNSQNQNVINQKKPEIRYPKNNSVITGNSPIVKGYGVTGEKVDIEINTNPAIIASVYVDEKGEWDLPMRQAIAPGSYTLSIITRDKNLRTVRISHNFTMIKSGEQVLGDSDVATPSGTLTPTLGSSTISPTVTIATISATIAMTYVTATPAPPVSGANTVPVVLTGIGILIFGLGFFLLL